VIALPIIGTLADGEARGAFEFGILTAEEDDTFTLPLYDGGDYDFTVDWGDSTSDNISAWDDAAKTHTYEDAGASSYNISITGVLNGWKFKNAGDCQLMRAITQWGIFQPGNGAYVFQGCDDLTISATDVINLSGVTTLNNFFQGCGELTTIPSANDWNVSSVIDFGAMFHYCVKFNQDISNWNLSSAIDIGYMFYHCDLFDQDLDSWDVSGVITMNWMFYEAAIFNGNISSWATTSLASVDYMFRNAALFNQDVSGFDVSGVDNFSGMFLGCTAFNQDISGWNMSAATDLSNMFHNAIAFDQDLSGWDITSVTTMDDMLEGVTLSTANYDAILIGWEGQVEHADVPFDAGGSQYSAGAAATAKEALETNGWIIVDGGQVE